MWRARMAGVLVAVLGVAACNRDAATPMQPPAADPAVATTAVARQAPRLEDVIERDPRYIIGISYPPVARKYPGLARLLETYARDKLVRKNLDMIVANDVSQAGLGFGAERNAALLLWREAQSTSGRLELPAQSKAALAEAIIDTALARWHATQSSAEPPQQDTP